jgi:hypothetical protein
MHYPGFFRFPFNKLNVPSGAQKKKGIVMTGTARGMTWKQGRYISTKLYHEQAAPTHDPPPLIAHAKGPFERNEQKQTSLSTMKKSVFFF